MDKQEYRLRAEEIKSLIAKRDFFGAVKIAEEIDWTRVRSVAMLCTVSDLYKANRRYQESKELLMMAYERHPNGRMILYSLCELCIKMGEVVEAVEYYKKFVQLAPMDNGKFVLQYKLYVAQEVSLEERIAVLEELKKRDYREKWGYELAYLYHRIGLVTKCVEECDELILWFSDGRYVKKAMELKMLHQPLTVAQEASYNAFIGRDAQLPKQETAEEKPIEDQIKEPSVNVGQYDTINLQKALAESMKEVLSPVVSDSVWKAEDASMGGVTSQMIATMFQNVSNMKEVYFEDNTDEMVSSSAQVEEPVTEEETPKEEMPVKESPDEVEPAVPAMAEAQVVQQEEKIPAESFVETKKIEVSLKGVPYEVPTDATKEIPSVREIMERPPTSMAENAAAKEQMKYTEDGIPSGMADLLSQEYDGQIGLVVEKETTIEKQITGQMNINEVLEEWEKTKKEYEEKRTAERTRKVLEQTGDMFTEFEQKVRDGILEQLQEEAQTELEKTEEAVEEKVDSESLEMEKENPVNETPAVQDTGSEEPCPALDKEETSISNLEDTAALEELIREEESLSKDTGETIEEKQEKLHRIQQVQEEIRELSEEEKALFAPFIQTRGAKRRFIKALDMISLAAYTGNVIVTGDADSDTVKLAKNIMKDIQMTDANFSGVIAKISGSSLNSKSVESTIAKLNNGGLIIERASEMNSQAVMKLLKALNQEKTGIVVILEDNKQAMKRMLAAYPSMDTFFNVHVEVEELNNDALAAYGKKYAAYMGYSIDALGMLALQTLIVDRQTSEHIVTVAEVREIVDEAIVRVNRKTLGHFLDVIMRKRYDEERMIILREKDFD